VKVGAVVHNSSHAVVHRKFAEKGHEALVLRVGHSNLDHSIVDFFVLLSLEAFSRECFDGLDVVDGFLGELA